LGWLAWQLACKVHLLGEGDYVGYSRLTLGQLFGDIGHSGFPLANHLAYMVIPYTKQIG
jgi:hypothetical protein